MQKRTTKRIIMISIVTILTLVAGCTSKGGEESNRTSGKFGPKAIEAPTEGTESPEPVVKESFGEPKIVDYNLGESEIAQASGRKVPYTVKGMLGVPTGTGARPVVFILHGSHEIKNYDTDRYDQGFSYLVKDLAKRGYLTVSVDVNAQYVLEHGEPIANERFNAIMLTQLKAFKHALQSGDAGYGVSLKGRGDLKRVSLVGHSRGGQLTHAFADLVAKDADIKLEGIVLAAPIELLEMETPFPDVPLGFILPQYDGDVTGLYGQRMYDREALRQDRKHPMSLVYLYGANHNFFNSKLEGVDDGVERSKQNDDLQKRVTAAEQQQFLSRYAGDFLESLAPDGAPSFWAAPAIATSGDKPGMLYGLPALQSVHFPKTKYIIHPIRDGKKPPIGSADAPVPSSGVKLQYLVDSYIPSEDETGPFIPAGDPKAMNLLNVRWTKRGESLTMKVPPQAQPPSKDAAVTIYVAADPADALNAMGDNPAFTVTLADMLGNESSYSLPADTPATRLQPGKVLRNEFMSYWSTFTPLSTLRIPLSAFTGQGDLKDVSSLTLKFDQTESGAIMIGNVGIEPPASGQD